MRWLVELTSVYKSRVSTSCQPPVVVVRLVTVSSDSWTAVVKENLLLFLTGKCFRESFYFTVCTETLKCMLGKVSTLYCTKQDQGQRERLWLLHDCFYLCFLFVYLCLQTLFTGHTCFVCIYSWHQSHQGDVESNGGCVCVCGGGHRPVCVHSWTHQLFMKEK